MEPIHVARLAVEHLLVDPCIARVDRGRQRVQVLLGEHIKLLAGLSVTHRHAFDLILLDVPRASKRQKAPLLTIAQDGGVSWTEVAHDDPEYSYRFRSTTLFHVRLALSLLSESGVVLAIATPGTYLAIRSSIEQFMGADAFIGELVYQTRSGGGNDSRWMSVEHETLLIFANNPAAVSRFTLDKDPKALAKYREQDSESRFYWDTFIRKNARNYYAIRCPDGCLLERDDSGNPISWLWREATFLEMLAKGDVKFEEHSTHPRWRLYYKDRMKELKILRSLVLNRTALDSVSAHASSEDTGAGLLTQDGSAEIKDYAGTSKPDYLKSSRFFRFVLQVFGRSGTTLIPFNEYGAAVEAASHPSLAHIRLVTLSNADQLPLINWRLEKLSAAAQGDVLVRTSFPAITLTSPHTPPEELRAFLETYAEGTDSRSVEWHDVSRHGIHCVVGLGHFCHLLVHDLPEGEAARPPIDVLDQFVMNGSLSGRRVRVWSTFSEPVVRQSLSLPSDVDFFMFPAFALP